MGPQHHRGDRVKAFRILGKSADRFRLRHPRAETARTVALSPGEKIHTSTFLITIYPRNEPMDTPFPPFYICLAT
jgi:hypothetical protein